MTIEKITKRNYNFPLEYCSRCGTYYKYDYCKCYS